VFSVVKGYPGTILRYPGTILRYPGTILRYPGTIWQECGSFFCLAIDKCCFAINKCCFAINKSCFAIDKCCLAIDKFCFAINKCCFAINKCCFAINKCRPSLHNARQEEGSITRNEGSISPEWTFVTRQKTPIESGLQYFSEVKRKCTILFFISDLKNHAFYLRIFFTYLSISANSFDTCFFIETRYRPSCIAARFPDGGHIKICWLTFSLALLPISAILR
jgi:hypothetical protein